MWPVLLGRAAQRGAASEPACSGGGAQGWHVEPTAASCCRRRRCPDAPANYCRGRREAGWRLLPLAAAPMATAAGLLGVWPVEARGAEPPPSPCSRPPQLAGQPTSAPPVSAARERPALQQQRRQQSQRSQPPPGRRRQDATPTAPAGAQAAAAARARAGAPPPPEPAKHPPPPPPPPPLPDHSASGHTLVATLPDLQTMLDQLVSYCTTATTTTAAAATAAAPSAAAASASGASAAANAGTSTPVVPATPGAAAAASATATVRPLAVDCEGLELGRPGGRLCLLQLAARGRSGGAGGSGAGGGGGGRGERLAVWLVDVHALGAAAFSARSRCRLAGRDGGQGTVSLGELLQSKSVTKYLYDVRSDASALASQFGVQLGGVYDLQLADVAARQAEGEAGDWVEGLVRALSRRLASGGPRAAPSGLADELAAAAAVSRRYHEGGDTQAWQRRPLPPELCAYAASDVRHLHALADALEPRLPRPVRELVELESHRRLRQQVPYSDKEARAAAPVLIPERRHGARRGPVSGGGGAAAAGSGRRSGPGTEPGAGLQWLTAALLLRYNGSTTTAAAAGVEPAGEALATPPPLAQGAAAPEPQTLAPPTDAAAASAASGPPTVAAALEGGGGGAAAAAAAHGRGGHGGAAPASFFAAIHPPAPAAAAAAAAVAQPSSAPVAELQGPPPRARPLHSPPPRQPLPAAPNAQQQQQHQPQQQARAPPPALRPLMLPTQESLAFAEQALVGAWLEDAAAAEQAGREVSVGSGPRAAVAWLLRVQAVLRARVRGAGLSVARDPGLRWLLGGE